MLMNRSALLLLAKAARASRATVSSPPRVSSTRMPRRASIAALSWRAIDSTTFFSSVPEGPRAPFSVPPCPGSITIVRTPVDSGSERRCLERWRHRRRRSVVAGAGAVGWSVAVAAVRMSMRQAQLGALPLLGGAVARERRAEREFDGRRRHDAAGGQQRRRTDAAEVSVQCVGGEADQQFAALVDDRLRHGRSDHERDAGAVGQRFGPGGHRRHTQRPDHDQRRPATDVDARIGARRQRPLDQLDGQEPRGPLPHRRRRQADDTSFDRGESLGQRDDHGPGAQRDHEPAGAVLPQHEAEQATQVGRAARTRGRWPSESAVAASRTR